MGRGRPATERYGGRGFSLHYARGTAGRTAYSPHFHDEYLICAQLRGDEQCHVGGTLHRFFEGDVVFINPQQVHTGNARGDDIEYVSLYIDRELVLRLAADLAAPTSQPEFTVLRASGQRELTSAVMRLLNQVRRLELEPLRPEVVGAHDPRSALEVDTVLQELLARAFKGFSNLRAPRLHSTARIAHRKIARVLEYLRGLPPNAASDRASLDRLATEAQLSKFHFVRQFQRSVGMTPGAYLRMLRLCHASQRLRRSHDPIVSIATAVGFADHASFSRAFARHMDMTPSQYRALGRR